MADQPLQGSGQPELDSAGWVRLGQIAEATQTALSQQAQQQQQTPDPRKGPGQLFGQLLADTLATLQRDWHRLWHPLQSIREWWAQQTQAQQSFQDQGSTRDTGPSPDKPTPPDRGPTSEAIWTQVRDQLFEAAKNPKADPKTVADSIVASIPQEHRAAVAERLTWLAEMAQTTAKSLQSSEAKTAAQTIDRAPLGEPPPEQKIESPLPDNVRLLKTRPERQVPKQPLPDSPAVNRKPSTQTQTQTQTRAKVR